MCDLREFYLLDKNDWNEFDILETCDTSCVLWYTGAITIHLARSTLPIILPVLHPGYIPANPIIRNFGPLPRRSFYSRLWLTRVLRLILFCPSFFLVFYIASRSFHRFNILMSLIYYHPLFTNWWTIFLFLSLFFSFFVFILSCFLILRCHQMWWSFGQKSKWIDIEK